jgi:hypothetical protein
MGVIGQLDAASTGWVGMWREPLVIITLITLITLAAAKMI